MNRKTFSQRFNREISVMGLPEDLNEKVKAVSKVFNVTRYLANAMLFGHAILSESELDHIARVLGVCPQWLCGNTERRKAYPGEELEDA